MPDDGSPDLVQLIKHLFAECGEAEVIDAVNAARTGTPRGAKPMADARDVFATVVIIFFAYATKRKLLTAGRAASIHVGSLKIKSTKECKATVKRIKRKIFNNQPAVLTLFSLLNEIYSRGSKDNIHEFLHMATEEEIHEIMYILNNWSSTQKMWNDPVKRAEFLAFCDAEMAGRDEALRETDLGPILGLAEP